jgi:hypothetical protein
MDASALARSVIFLFAVSGPTAVPIGTGFVVGLPVTGDDAAMVPVVVTAKHVLAGQSRVVARFNASDGKTTKEVTFDLSRMRADGDVWEHSDSGVDLVAFRTLHFQGLDYSPVPLSALASAARLKEDEIKATDGVVFPSLLVNLMGSSRNYPVVRKGQIALIPDAPIPIHYKCGNQDVNTAQEIILLDALAVPGASGSPVFLDTDVRTKSGRIVTGGVPWLLGVIHGFYPAVPRELFTASTTNGAQGFQENTGIAIVFPAWRLRELLEQPAVRVRIESLLKKQKSP